LEGRDTNIRDLIEIDGYYYTEGYPNSNCRMFFEDGMWVSFSFQWGTTENESKSNMLKYIGKWTEKKQVRWGDFWGVYKIVNDTLVVYRYMKGSFWAVWSLYEEKYKIIDKRTIKRVSYSGLLKADHNSCKVLNEDYFYVAADSLPTSDCWLKEEKWIWRNEQDWKNYMEKIKQNKQH
jgi:hypothetical protein